jgi:cell division protein FtsN
MQQAFDDEDFQPAQKRRDTELTLGPGLVTGLVLGLVLLCGLSFGLGYKMGHSSAPPPAAAPSAAAAPLAAQSGHPKPPASPTGAAPAAQIAPTQTPVQDENAPPLQEPSDAISYSSKLSAPPATSAVPSVHPSLPLQPPANSAAPVVQIAAVSHAEDAEVLVNALRKRGYAVTVSQDPSDSLLHVRIGPFASRVEAFQWRQKLLSDGYNAIVQP